MKKKKITVALLSLLAVIVLTACGANDSPKDNPVTPTPPVVNPSGDNPSDDNPSGDNPSGDNPSTEDEAQIVSNKTAAIAKLDELVNPVINKISDEDLKEAIQTYYNSEKQYINGITDLDTAKAAVTKVVNDTKAFAIDTLKPLAVEKLNSIINPLISKITHTELKESVQEFYDDEMEKIDSVQSLSECTDTFKEILDDTKEFISTETEKILIALKNKALEELDPYVLALIDKIPYDELKDDTTSFYNEEKKKLDKVDSFDGFTPCVNEIKDDLEEFALSEAKKIAVVALEDVINAGIDRIPNPEFQEDLEEFSKEEIAKLNAVTKLEDVPTTLTTILAETEEHIKELIVSTVKAYAKRLTEVETTTAYDYLPESMHPAYQNNVVDASNINYDFTSFTNVSNINQAGFGEQWQMVVENINQSVAMSKVFNAAQTVLGTIGNAVDIYITNSYQDEMSYTLNGDGYTGLFGFEDYKLVFNITLTKDISIPVFGSLKPILRMEYDLVKNSKCIFISLGDSYKLYYLISDNAYEMATTYGITISGKSASRTSYLSVTKDDDITIGHIYEYTTIQGSDLIKACADFYVQGDYVSVVGNKSSGLVGFKGYINELYSKDEGRLLGYEVREELTIAGITGTYNTLWFNLWDVDGIESVKVLDKSDSNKSSLSTVDVYLNDSSKLFAPTYNSKLIVKTSRKYDIEYRMRYYYTYDSINDEYVANEIKVPMLFVQEGENFNSFKSDMLSDNNINVQISIPQTHLNKILLDYDTLIDIFIENKDSMSSEMIVSCLEQFE